MNATFGFQIGDNLNDFFEFEFFDSKNIKIDNNIIKICDANIKEIKESKINSSNFFICFIDYPVIGSNKTNHILKTHIKYNEKKLTINKRIPLVVKFIEPSIKHKNENPFDYSELYEMLFFYETQSATSYRKYIKIINYKTEGFFHKSQENSAYLEDFEDSLKMNTNNDDKIIGSFRFSLSKKKDIFERKYINWLDYILDMISKFISFKAGFSFLTQILVNPIDKLRIFASFNNKKPSLFNETSNLIIDNWYKKNNEEPNNNNRIIINKNFSFCDKLKFLLKKN